MKTSATATSPHPHGAPNVPNKSPSGVNECTGPHIEIASSSDAHELIVDFNADVVAFFLENRVGEQDPVVALGWNTALDEVVRTMKAALPHVAIPTWLGLAYPFNGDQLKLAILQFCQVGVTAEEIVDMFSIAPNTTFEAMNIATQLRSLSVDPFIHLLFISRTD